MFLDILKGIGFYVLGIIIIIFGLAVWFSGGGSEITVIIGLIVIIVGIAVMVMGKKVVGRA